MTWITARKPEGWRSDDGATGMRGNVQRETLLAKS
jgi:hypothetical protein